MMSLLFKRYGVPPKMIVDNSKEKYLRYIARKCIEAECHLVNSEPYFTWLHMYEWCIRELKRGSLRLLINLGSPKSLWGHCIEFQAFIFTIHPIVTMNLMVKCLRLA